MTMNIKQSGSHLEIVSFHLGDQEFCIDIMAIREIRAWTPVTRLPQVPAHVAGVVNLRGTVLPVIDLAARLGWTPTQASARHAIIVTQLGGKACGLIVESVSDIVTIPAGALQPPPAGAPAVALRVTGPAEMPRRQPELADWARWRATQ